MHLAAAVRPCCQLDDTEASQIFWGSSKKVVVAVEFFLFLSLSLEAKLS